MKRLLLLCSLPLSLLSALAAGPTALISQAQPMEGWSFNNGQEFPGATGGLTADPEASRGGLPTLKLVGDFTKGGQYVVAGHKIEKVEFDEISFWLRSPEAQKITFRVNDATGQTHQIDLKLEPQPDWQHVVLPLQRFFEQRGTADAVTEVTRYESWGGAKDGKWHGPGTALYVLASPRPEAKVRTLWLNDLRLQARAGVAQAPAFATAFTGTQAPAGWVLSPGVSVAPKPPGQTGSALLLRRTVEQATQETTATGPVFPVQPGQWELRSETQAALESPDSSYHAVIALECLDAAGKSLERLEVADLFGRRPWTEAAITREIPAGATQARFAVKLEKTWGEFRVASLSAAYLAPAARRDDRVTRVLFATKQLGNLLFPEDPRTVQVIVEARQPLENARLSWHLRDYWGAEQTRPAEVSLTAAPAPASKEKRYAYTGALELGPLEQGRYYELHAAVLHAQAGEPLTNFTSLAILPPAPNRQYRPEEIPFTSRNWDNRIQEYIRLTDRLGVRICGVWGRWSAKPPYAPEAPNLELVRELGMGWLTGTPIAQLELGKTEYDETALRQGIHNLIMKYGGERPFYINLGNEPHGKGDRVKKNVEAYRAVYEEAKKTDPTIPVIATSVEPNEEYFQNGYAQWCDAFDFHVYEGHEAVRKSIGQYRELMAKYHCEKPIWSTELGRNSQGQTRQAVASEVVKVFTTFFAAGGASASWFGLLYPDPEGKSFGSSGDSHNIFDCRYNRYAPRLDAIAYYHAVNAIGIKKFVAEKKYANGVEAYLFRDRNDQQLLVLWKDEGRADIGLPLPGVQEVEVIRLDGSHRKLQAENQGVTLTVTHDPLMLLYRSPATPLPEKLSAPLATAQPLPKTLTRGAPIALTLENTKLASGQMKLTPPAFWQVTPTKTGFTATPPPATLLREADFTVTLQNAAGQPTGELYLRGAYPR